MDKHNQAHPAAEFTLSPPVESMPTLRLDRTSTGEFGSDFSLPDYLPEIKRLLRVTAAPLPESRYVGGSSVEYAGCVEYLVFYSGADGTLRSTRLRQDYSFNLPVDPDLLVDGIEPHADLTVDSLLTRVTAPRKLNIRCRLRCRVRGWGEESLSPMIEGDPSPAVLERLIKPARAMQLLRAASDPVDLGGEIPLGGEGQGEVRVISSDAAVVMQEVSAAEGMVNCRGELVLRVLTAEMSDEGEAAAPPEMHERRVEFAEQISVPGAMPAMQARGWGRCGDLAVSVETGRLLCDATVWLEVEAAAEREIETTADLYATDGEMADCAYREIEPITLARCANINLPVSGALLIGETGLDPAAEIVDVAAFPQVDAMEWNRGRAAMSGSCKFNLIYRLDGEFAALDVALPIAFEVECGDLPPTDREIELVCAQANARIDGAGEHAKLALDARMCGAIRLTGRNKCRVLSRAIYRPIDTVRGSGCTVCFPERDDSLWSLCKRYRVSHRALESENRLRITADADMPTSLDGVRYLIF